MLEEHKTKSNEEFESLVNILNTALNLEVPSISISGNTKFPSKNSESSSGDTKFVQFVFYTPEAEMEETHSYARRQTDLSYHARRAYYDKINKINSTWNTPTLVVNSKLGLLDFSYDIEPPSVTEIENCLKDGRKYGYVANGRKGIGWQCPGMMCGSQPEMAFDENDSEIQYFDENETMEEISRIMISPSESITDPRTSDVRKMNAVWPEGFLKLSDKIVEWKSVDKSTRYFKPACCHVEMILWCDSKPGDYYAYYIRQGDKLIKKKNKRYASSVKNVYTVLNLTIDAKAHEKLREYCDTLEGILEFNGWGLMWNHAVPRFLASWMYTNGRSYYNESAAYCSEFIARALCEIGIFKDINGRIVSNYQGGTKENPQNTSSSSPSSSLLSPPLSIESNNMKIISNMFENMLGNEPTYKCSEENSGWMNFKTKELFVDPSTVSPNYLFLFLWVKERMFRVGKGEGYPSMDPKDPFRALNYGSLPEKIGKHVKSAEITNVTTTTTTTTTAVNSI